MKKVTRLTFNNWNPDAPEVDNPAFDVLEGWPGPVGYREPLDVNPSFTNSAASTKPTGIEPVIALTGERYMFWATQDRLFRFSGTATFTDVTGTATHNVGTAAAGGRTEFVQWGEKVLSTNFESIPLSMTVDGTSFADIGATADVPRMKHITTARNFVIGGYTHDTVDGTSPNRVRWSAINDETDWTVSAVTQADFQDLLNFGGVVQRVMGGEYVTVFQERAIQRMTYVGPPAIWQFDEVASDVGLLVPGGAAKHGNDIYFLSDRGFYVLRNGTELVDIGSHRVNSFFFRNLNSDRREAISCAVSNKDSRVFWNYPKQGKTAGTSGCMVYDYVLDKWGHHTAELYGVIATAVNSDAPDTSVGETIAEARWFDGTSVAGIGFRMKVSAGQKGRIKTGWIELEQARNSMILGLRPGIRQRSDSLGNYGQNQFWVHSVDAGFAVQKSATIQAGELLAGSTDNTTNRYSLRTNGRYHQIEWEWYSIQGTNESDFLLGDEVSYLDVEYAPTHKR